MITYAPTEPWHIDHVAAHMRDADAAEVAAAAGRTPLGALTRAVRLSDQSVTVLSPCGTPLVIFGIAPRCRLTGVGVPWMLGTDAALRFRRHFLTDTPHVLDTMLDLYPVLENYVHIDNRLSVRWLKALGFIMDEPITLVSGEKFMRFSMRRKKDV